MTLQKKPDWLKITCRESPNRAIVEELLKDLSLNTVCSEAACPNYMECFNRKTATFMILGVHCTRNCRFCNVQHQPPQEVNPDEPANVAEAVKRLGLRYVVITSVTRDDLPDGGAEHFAKVVREINKASPGTFVETLIPDFQGNCDALQVVARARPHVISHNIETVPRLYGDVRPQADYRQSLEVIRLIKEMDTRIRSKTGIMLGLGEKHQEVIDVLHDLRSVNCEFLTIGQYLAPSKAHHSVVEFIRPDVFNQYGEEAAEMGFVHVASAPFVRSSYHADKAVEGLAP